MQTNKPLIIKKKKLALEPLHVKMILSMISSTSILVNHFDQCKTHFAALPLTKGSKCSLSWIQTIYSLLNAIVVKNPKICILNLMIRTKSQGKNSYPYNESYFQVWIFRFNSCFVESLHFRQFVWMWIFTFHWSIRPYTWFRPTFFHLLFFFFFHESLL